MAGGGIPSLVLCLRAIKDEAVCRGRERTLFLHRLIRQSGLQNSPGMPLTIYLAQISLYLVDSIRQRTGTHRDGARELGSQMVYLLHKVL